MDDSSVVVLFRSDRKSRPLRTWRHCWRECSCLLVAEDSAAAFQFLTSLPLDGSAPLEYLPLVAPAEPPFTSVVHLRMALGSDVKQKVRQVIGSVRKPEYLPPCVSRTRERSPNSTETSALGASRTIGSARTAGRSRLSTTSWTSCAREVRQKRPSTTSWTRCYR